MRHRAQATPPPPRAPPRYFTAPLLLLALHMPAPTRQEAWLVLATYAAINAATLHLFLARPFAWADGSEARFMW